MHGNTIRKYGMLFKVHLSPKRGQGRRKKEEIGEHAGENKVYFEPGQPSGMRSKQRMRGEMRRKGIRQPESYLKLDESVHGSIDMDVNRETFK